MHCTHIPAGWDHWQQDNMFIFDGISIATFTAHRKHFTCIIRHCLIYIFVLEGYFCCKPLKITFLVLLFIAFSNHTNYSRLVNCDNHATTHTNGTWAPIRISFHCRTVGFVRGALLLSTCPFWRCWTVKQFTPTKWSSKRQWHSGCINYFQTNG